MRTGQCLHCCLQPHLLDVRHRRACVQRWFSLDLAPAMQAFSRTDIGDVLVRQEL